MKLRQISHLTSLTCLCLTACQSKDKAVNANQNSDAELQADVTKSDHGIAKANHGINVSNHGMAVSQFKGVLKGVNAQCPENYPDVVTPLPENKDFESIKTADLMKMLESWNPSLRAQAAQALSERGTEVLSILKQATISDNWMIRAGSATALSAIIKQELNGLSRDNQQAVKKKHAAVITSFVKLTSDDRLEVRVAALSGLNTVAPQTPEAAMAVLKLCDDPDDYLSQDAMITLDKRFSINALEQDLVMAAFRSSLKRDLPRGKGHIVRIIKRMKPDVQRQFIPDLLAHLDWKPMRDTMFGSGGQGESIELLTKMKETQIVKRLPKLMGKFERGGGLFSQCLIAAKTFGKDAKVIVPELKAILADCETNGSKAKIRPTRDVEASLKGLKKTIEYLESL